MSNKEENKSFYIKINSKDDGAYLSVVNLGTEKIKKVDILDAIKLYFNFDFLTLCLFSLNVLTSSFIFVTK